MLLGIFILIATTVTTNGLPYTDTQGNYHTPQFPDASQLDQQTTNLDFADSNLNLDANEPGFLISCSGPDRTCVNKHFCLDGYVYSNGHDFLLPPHGHEQLCRVDEEVCCTIVLQGVIQESVAQEAELAIEAEQAAIDFDQTEGSHVGEPLDQPSTAGEVGIVEQKPSLPPQIGEESGSAPVSGSESLAVASHVQLGCAAALICVEEKFCTMDGTISPEPVILTSKQILRRVPLSSCKNPDNGVIGKCCRDPNYVDPWPTGNLPANYSGGFDEQGFPTFLNIAKVKPTPKPDPRPEENPSPLEENVESAPFSENTSASPVVSIPPNDVATSINSLESVPPPVVNSGLEFSAGSLQQQCGVKNNIPRRPGMEESETMFAEIPWQAMVLHSKERKILCSGALIGVDNILTAANCVDRLSPNDVSIKLGEWKLGYEIQQEEPLPFEILNVSSIRMHPEYTPGLPSHDLALLHLGAPATLDFHVSPLCLPETENIAQESRRCLTTGWGKEILQVQYAGAIMHAVDVNVLPVEGCKERLSNTDLRQDMAEAAICATTKKERNNVCEADIGGPLACENERGTYELAGVYSQDTGCLSTDQVALFAPLDDKWLKETLVAPELEQQPLIVPEPVQDRFVEVEESLPTNNYRDSNLSTDNQYLPPN